MGSEAILAAEFGTNDYLTWAAAALSAVAGIFGLTSAARAFVTQSRIQRKEESRQIDSLRAAWDPSGRVIEAFDSIEVSEQAKVPSEQDHVEGGESSTPDHVRDMRLRTSTSYQVLTDHYSNALSQSRVYAYLSYFVGLLGFIIMIVGVVMVYGGSLDSGILAAVVGAVVEGAAGLVFVLSRKANGDSQQNLQLLADTVQQDNNREIALHLVASIEDPRERDRALADLARQAMASATAIRRPPSDTPEVTEGASTATPSESLANSDAPRLTPPRDRVVE
ncbi:hypothetical protein LRS71_17740 [Rhodococcus pyridinivorans]|uniref:TRADD-N-associated membrane domain-containing protein n=1 Tax=Rhodococcus pyridinivorans TaxID=103816 RepID=UPI001E569B45|nr:hypothetical protein [Rhodococcus pyridinivorans]MCD5421378.1 hypothetical protein [Rhodococcus pyridinivorans]